MGAPKPCLGYPSRTAAVLAMRQANVPTAMIASRIGIEPKTVVALENSAKQSRSLAARGYQTILFSPDVFHGLQMHAQQRGVSARELARQIVEAVIEDDLIGAVLDDGAN